MEQGAIESSEPINFMKEVRMENRADIKETKDQDHHDRIKDQ